MLVPWIFAGVLAGIEGQVCPNFNTYNDCGQTLQHSFASVTNQNALTFEVLNFICGIGIINVKCFLDGLQTCPNSSIAFKSGFTQQQWNVQLIRELLASGCQSAGALAYMSNYGCIRPVVYSSHYDTCISQALVANPLGVDSSISCGLQKSGMNCINTHIGSSCKNQRALDFLLKWYYIKGKFEHDCSGVESIMIPSIEGQVCPNFKTYNDCGQTLQHSFTSVTKQNALTFEVLNFICGIGISNVKCFLDGLQTCPDLSIAFKSEFTKQQWNVELIRELLASGCQSAGALAYMSNYGCIRPVVYSSHYDTCISQALVANPLGVDSSISCGLQKSGMNCINTLIGSSCKNQKALDFLLKWYYIKGKFEHDCSGVESIMIPSIEGQVCPNFKTYNDCGQTLQNSFTSVTNKNVLTFDVLNFICGIGITNVKCFLDGLQTCPDLSIAFKSEFTKQQWNVELIRELLASGCQSPGALAFMTNYGCIRRAVYSSHYDTCMSQAIAANPLGDDSSISCGLQSSGMNCINTLIGSSCKNQKALDFLLKWYYIKGKFENDCSGVESIKIPSVEGQVCPNVNTYNDCGQKLQNSFTAVTNQNALTFEVLNFICGIGITSVNCFLNGLQTCPDSSIAFKSEFTKQQWNVQLIRELLASGCQSPGAIALMSNYGCIRPVVYSSNYNTCMSQALAANPLGEDSSISCGLQKSGMNCINAHIGSSCKNQTALDFLLKWYYIKGKFENVCSGVESLTISSKFPLVGTIYIFLMLLL